MSFFKSYIIEIENPQMDLTSEDQLCRVILFA